VDDRATVSAAEGRDSIAIRRATESDREALGRYGAALMRQHHASDPRRFILTEDPERGYGRFLVSQLDDPDTLVLVAERSGRVLGYVFATIEGISWRDLRGPGGFVHDVYVAEEARHQGIARELLRTAIDWIRSRGMRQVVLWSKSRNAAAQSLFHQLGFRETMIEMTLDLGDGGSTPG
jgi:ribosomal protein S18 acetylase RimI-like enzyme